MIAGTYFNELASYAVKAPGEKEADKTVHKRKAEISHPVNTNDERCCKREENFRDNRSELPAQ